VDRWGQTFKINKMGSTGGVELEGDRWGQFKCGKAM